MTKSLKGIKRRLRELRTNPGQPGARAEIQRLIGELTRAAQAKNITDMQGPASRTTAPRQSPSDLPRRPGDPITGREDVDPKKPIMLGNDDVSSWPPELRSRARLWRS